MSSSRNGTRSAKSLHHLAALSGRPPANATGKVVWAWPQISAALQHGWRMFDVWTALQRDGLDIPYDQFRVYVSRVRRRLARSPLPPISSPAPVPSETAPEAGEAVKAAPEPALSPAPRSDNADPYSAVREQRKIKRKSGFEFDPFSSNKDLLE